MKKLLLTLGTVAAVAAPVASVVACGTSTELQKPEFQKLVVSGITWNSGQELYSTSDLKGFVLVEVTAGSYLIPAKDLDKDGKKVIGDSATTITTPVTNVVKGKVTVVAEKTEIAKIAKGLAGKVIKVADKPGVLSLLKTHGKSTLDDTDKIAPDPAKVKAAQEAKDFTEQDVTLQAAYDNYFNPINDALKAAALTAAKNAAIKGLTDKDGALKAAKVKAINAASTVAKINAIAAAKDVAEITSIIK